MTRVVRIAALFAMLLSLGAALTGWCALKAMQQVRPFYSEALRSRIKPDVLARASRELETQAGALYSDTQHGGHWSAVFTVEQVNAWLALEFERDYSHWLPPTIRDPRVAIEPGRLNIGFRSRQAGIETVISVEAQVFLSEPNVVAIRLQAVRAGALPLPVSRIADKIRQACQGWKRPVRWTQVDGDVVALIEVAAPRDERLTIDTLELLAGEIYIAGSTQPGENKKSIVPISLFTLEHIAPPAMENPEAQSVAEGPPELARRAADDSSGNHSNRQ